MLSRSFGIFRYKPLLVCLSSQIKLSTNYSKQTSSVLYLFQTKILCSSSSRTMAGDLPTRTISYVTISNEEGARKLARSLVENRLAACVNIVKEVKSVYEWRGKIEEDSESMLIVKSDSSKTSQLTQFIESNHPYDCPEIVSVKIESGSKKYLDWISETLSKPPLNNSTSK